MAGGGSIDDAGVRTFMKSVESSVVHYGSTVSSFLRTLADADDRGETEALSYVSAIAVEEKQVWDYNDGNPEFFSSGEITGVRHPPGRGVPARGHALGRPSVCRTRRAMGRRS